MMHPETRAAIIAMCRYITDDSTIAAYVKVPKSEVAKLRKVVWRNGRVGNDGRTGTAYQSNTGSAEPIGLDRKLAHRRDAEQGSRALLKALDRYWRNRGVPGPWMQESAA